MISFDWLTLQLLGWINWFLIWIAIGLKAREFVSNNSVKENEWIIWAFCFVNTILGIMIAFVPNIPLSLIFNK